MRRVVYELTREQRAERNLTVQLGNLESSCFCAFQDGLE
jgi:hypothetical protein